MNEKKCKDCGEMAEIEGRCENCHEKETEALEQDALREMGLEDAEFYSPNIGCK